MGGVDLLDNMVTCYRVPYQKKKWWFTIYIWSLSVSAVNAWRLCNREKTYYFFHKLNKMINNRIFKKNKLDIIFFTDYWQQRAHPQLPARAGDPDVQQVRQHSPKNRVQLRPHQWVKV